MSASPSTVRLSQSGRLLIVLALNLALIGGLVAAGIMAHSVSVLAAAGDTLADCVALILGLIAIAVRDRDPDRPHPTRPTAIAALVNATLLVMVTLSVGIEAVMRLRDGSPAVLGLPMALVSLVTLGVMIAGALVLGMSARREDIHMKSVLVDTLSDAAAAGGVLVAGAIIWLSHGLYWLDPVIALALAAVIGYTGIRLASQAIAALCGSDVDFDTD